MKSRKLVTILVTVAFIGATGVFYFTKEQPLSMGTIRTTDEQAQLTSGEPKKQSYASHTWTTSTPVPTKQPTKTVSGMDVSDEQSGVNQSTHPLSEDKLLVYVCGEVVKPGVYELPTGSRIVDVIVLAGGTTSEAAMEAVNQADWLTDGQQITIPSKEQYQPKQNDTTKGNTSNEEGLINLNTASKDLLMQLPGIGEAKADAILRYRSENGGFQTKEDIMKIEGIKQGVYSKLKDLITIG